VGTGGSVGPNRSLRPDGSLPCPLLQVPALRYRRFIGTGGIGSGSFFQLNGEHTLGREESRSGRFLDRRDYCKLHIVSHYLRVLLGPQVSVVPIGRVGDDAVGRQLIQEMQAVGLDLSRVETLPGARTLFSFCFLYPDGSGGNLTTDNSASGTVDAALVDRAEGLLREAGAQGVAMALPEVPLEGRLRLLELAGRHGLFRAASFTSGELPTVRDSGRLEGIDLLAMNIDEARALAKREEPDRDDTAVVERTVSSISASYPRLRLSITAGPEGSWSWDGQGLAHCPVVPVQPVSTAGAGDAHMAGILAGLACGLELSSAQELGTLVAAAAVTSPHTIHDGLSREQLRSLWAESPAHRVSAAEDRTEEGRLSHVLPASDGPTVWDLLGGG